MARNFTTLPKVISKANKDISTIIENDIAKESVLLKDLVDQVLKSNIEVKKKNNQRILETKRKLKELDDQIGDLTSSIDELDRETIIQQLNEMIDAKNNIFNARQEIRFFDHERLASRLNTHKTIFKSLTSKIDGVNRFDTEYKEALLLVNKDLYSKQKTITDEIVLLMKQQNNEKREKLTLSITQLNDIKDKIVQFDRVYMEQLASSIQYEYELIKESKNNFYNVDSDDILNKQINEQHLQNVKDIDLMKKAIDDDYLKKQEEINSAYKESFEQAHIKFDEKNRSLLEKEEIQQKKIETELKNIRLDIMSAEKQNDYKKIQILMKKFEKVERQLHTKTSRKLNKESDDLIKSKRLKAIQALKDLEMKYTKEKHKQSYEESFEKIRFQEAKILHKIKLDHDGLTSDIDINKKRIQNMKELLKLKAKLQLEIHSLRLELRNTELALLKEYDYMDIEIRESFKQLFQALHIIGEKRIHLLKQNISTNKVIKKEHEYRLEKAIKDIKLDQDTHNIDKSILIKRNGSLIDQQKYIESLNSDVIYQESLIAIAKKEHELQRIKVQSLYENERSLAEEQKERINLGIKINDTFVKTTLQNQLLFAEQQIKCGESEFEIRVESINLTFDQEVQYANKKIEYYRQKYEYQKQKLSKELEDKLEDLNYKLLLFTESRDNKEIQDNIKKLTSYYEDQIDEIDDQEHEDPEIIRYEKVIHDAERRQRQAIEEAQLLREQTITSFQALYDATKVKYDELEFSQIEETKGIMPLLTTTTAKSSDGRLQQAIKEADILLAERLEEPERIVLETKEKIKELMNTDHIEKFITEQRELKFDVMKEHKEDIEELEENRIKNVLPLYDDLSIKAFVETDVKIDALFKDIDPLQISEIDEEYEERLNNERIYFNNIVTIDQVYIKRKIQEIDQVHKKSIELIKNALLPYKKYIRFASKGVNASKKELQREFEKKERKLLSDLEKDQKEKNYI